MNFKEIFFDNDLPEEIWLKIFRYLDVKSLQNTQMVCKNWLNIILNDVILSGEYTLARTMISSVEINALLAKRSKLKIFRCPRYHLESEGDPVSSEEIFGFLNAMLDYLDI